MTRILLVIILFVFPVALAPGAVAEATMTRDYEVWVHGANPANGVIAQTNVTVPGGPEGHRGDVVVSVWIVHGLYETQSGSLASRAVDYRLRIDGADVAGCEWTVRRDAEASATSESHTAVVRCLADAPVPPGNHTLEVAGTASGANPVQASRVDVTLLQTEVVAVASFEVADVAWVLWLVYAVLTFKLPNPAFRLGAALVGFMVIVLPLDPLVRDVLFLAQLSLVLAVVGVWLMDTR